MENNTFNEEIQSHAIDLPRAALHFAREIAYPGLNIGNYLALLDQLAGWGREVIVAKRSVITQAEALADFLFRRFGFQGNTEQYGDPRNSYLNEVLERRLGIPISLSAVYLAVAGRLGLPAAGVGMPGHFIVGVQIPGGNIYLDPFHGGARLTRDDCVRLVQTSTGYSGPFQPEWLEPTPPAAILVRMLNNLRSSYVQEQDWSHSLAVLERLQMLQPDLPEHFRDLGLIHHQMGALSKAIRYYEQYLVRAPEAQDAGTVRSNLEAAVLALGRLN